MADTRDPSVQFLNAVVCDGYHLPFVDRYAQFGVSFEPGGVVGPGMVQVRSTAMTFQVTCSTLALWLTEDGRAVSVPRSELRCLPWVVEESAVLENGHVNVAVEARHVFVDERRMLSEFVLVNNSDGPASVEPVWLGQFSGDRFGKPGDGRNYGYGVSGPPRRGTWAACAGGAVRGGLRAMDSDRILPEPTLGVRAMQPMTARVSSSPGWARDDAEQRGQIDAEPGTVLYYRFEAAPVCLPAGGRGVFAFVTELAVGTSRHPAAGIGDSCGEVPGMDDAVGASREEFLRRVDWDHPPEAGPALTHRLWRARTALLRTGYRNGRSGGEYGGLVASTCVPSCSGFTRVFFWDSLFTSVALSEFEPEFARGAVAAVFSRQDESGRCPEHSFNYHVPARDVVGAPQAPVATWAVLRYLKRHPEDTGFARDIFPALERNHRYWVEQGDRDRDGLAEWTWSGQTADNSPLFDEYTTGGGCGWLPPVASVQLNAFLYRDAMLLADLCERSGNGVAAAAYRRDAQRRAEALERVCYVADERRYWDYNHTTGRHRRVKTFYMFWPLWAGMPVDPETKRELIEEVLLDTRQFFGAIPFPSVAYDEPVYDATGYWRGRAWPHISYWLLQMLCREGYERQANQAADRILAAYMRDGTFAENLATDPALWGAAGQPDYNWGAAAFHLIATRDYAREE